MVDPGFSVTNSRRGRDAMMSIFKNDLAPWYISENDVKLLLRELAKLTNRLHFNSQHGALMSRLPVIMIPN